MDDGTTQVELLGLRLTTCSLENAVARILACSERDKLAIGFVNLHTANLACQRDGYREALNGFDFLFNDGVGLEIGCRLIGVKLECDLPGNVVVPALLRRWPRSPCRVFILGSAEGVARQAGTRMAKQFDNVEIAGTHHGFFSLKEESAVVELINASRSEILLVGMGNPLQEEFVARQRSALNVRVTMAVGGLVDIWGGKLTDYPAWATRWRCHWLLRIKQEPRRLLKRYLVDGIMFIPLLAKELLRRPKRCGHRAEKRS